MSLIISKVELLLPYGSSSYSRKYRLRNLIYTFLLYSFILTSGECTEFNLNVIDQSVRKNVDLDWFKDKTVIPPGEYLVTVSVNGNQLPDKQLIHWYEKDKGTEICISPELATRFGLRADVLNALSTQKPCTDFSSHPDIIFKFNLAAQLLDVSVPQAWLDWHSDGWVPPAEWSEGIAGFLLDYSLYGNTYQSDGDSRSNNANTYGTTGMNFGAWRLRSDFQYATSQYHGESTQSGDFSRTYLFRPLPTLGSRLTLGETDLKSSVFDTFSFTGISLNSDDRMLPWELRGYAPQVSGIAQTQATVTIRQSGRIIYQTSVAPGPFVIRDLTQTVQGTLDVTVTEADGRVNTFQVSAASVPFLTRQGQIRFNMAGGQARPDVSHHTSDDIFMQAEASWGMLSDTSLYGGGLVSGDDYRSLALGIGQNLLWFGALSLDTTWVSRTLPGQKALSGNSYRVTYSRQFDSTGSQITVAALRHSDREFLSYADFIERKNGNDDSTQKQQFSISGNQEIPALALTLYVSLLRQTWWDDVPSTTESVTLGHNFDLFSFKGLSASVSYSNTHYSDDKDDDREWYASLTVPFGNGQQLGYDMHHSTYTSQSVSWNNMADPNNTWGISAGADNAESIRSDVSGSFQHMSPAGELDLSGSWQENTYHSVSASWNGSLTATSKGWALHPKSTGTEPRILVSAEGVPGIPLDGTSEVTSRQGYAVIPVVSSYQPGTVSVNVNNLPDGVTVDDSVFKATWTEGAIGYHELHARGGADVYGEIHMHAGVPPLGASVRMDERNEDVGIVGEGGHVWLSGVKSGQHLQVSWGQQRCLIILPDIPDSGSLHLLLPCQ